MSKRIIRGVKGDKLTDVFVKAGICASKREAKRLIDNRCVRVAGHNAECLCDVEYITYKTNGD